MDKSYQAAATLSGEDIYMKKEALKDAARKAFLDAKARGRIRRAE